MMPMNEMPSENKGVKREVLKLKYKTSDTSSEK